MSVELEIADKLSELLAPPARYKVAYGGRGSGKSWAFARMLLAKGTQQPLKILCARELQVSIAESVHALLAGQVHELGLQGFYQVQQSSIFAPNGTQFIFAGIRNNPDKIKSMEGLDIAWVEEARNVSKTSWEILIPTVRKPNSEIWVSFNPELEEDETYRRFVKSPPTSALTVEVNHSDNPWFPEVLQLEMADLKARDYDEYLTVWEGKCRQFLDGAVYMKELRQATLENRITRVPLTPNAPVHTFWDLGHRDHTSIWFAQFTQGEYHIIDFYQNFGEQIGHYLEVLQSKRYLYGLHWLPHDAAAENLRGISIEKQVRQVYPNGVRVLERLDVTQGINAARRVFPLCFFDADRCAEGLAALKRYRYDYDADTRERSKLPLHDSNSDAADAFRYLAMSLEAGKPKRKLSPEVIDMRRGREPVSTGWMSN